MRINNFDGLRLAGALGVLWSHMFLLSGLTEPTTPIGGTYGHISVLMFFSISGYLVSLSWQRDPSPVAPDGRMQAAGSVCWFLPVTLVPSTGEA